MNFYSKGGTIGMKKRIGIVGFLTLLCVQGFFPSRGSAQEHFSPNGVNAALVYLTPGHVQNRFFPLDGLVINSSFNTSFFMVFGSGTVTVRVGVASSVGDYANITYGVMGFIGSNLLVDYGNDAETISLSAEVDGFALGMLFTGVTLQLGNPSYPIVMGMVASLL